MLSIYQRKIVVVVIFLVLLYFLLLLLFYFFSSWFIYQRTGLPKSHEFEFNGPFQEYFIATSDKDSLNIIVFKTPHVSKGLIFYLHGNADNLARWGEYAIDFTSLGYDVVMFDYRGYGKSTGTPNDKNIYEDASLVFDWVKLEFPHAKVVIYGRSLGSAVASRLSITKNPDLLILETPFANFTDVIYWPVKPAFAIFTIEANFSNEENLTKVNCRKIIFHGTNDWVVPLSSALKLKPLLGPSDEFIVIEGGGHRNLRDFKIYHSSLVKFLQ